MVNVSSVLAVRTGKEISDAYAAGKACVILLTGRVTSTWGSGRVCVPKVVCPGSIDTSMTSGSYNKNRPWSSSGGSTRRTTAASGPRTWRAQTADGGVRAH